MSSSAAAYDPLIPASHDSYVDPHGGGGSAADSTPDVALISTNDAEAINDADDEQLLTTTDSPRTPKAFKLNQLEVEPQGHMSFSSQIRKAKLHHTVYEDFSTIDWQMDAEEERQRLAELKRRGGRWHGFLLWWEKSQGWLIAALVGLVVGLFSSFIDLSLEWITDLKHGVCTYKLYLNEEFCCYGLETPCHDYKEWHELFGIESEQLGVFISYLLYVVIGVMMAVTSALFVKHYQPYATGSGIAEIKSILSGFVMRGYLGLSTLLVKTFALPLSIASGMAIGKEGPLVHVGAACANVVLRFFPKYHLNETKKREIISAGVAAGIGAAFGAPVGGVLFSLEEVSTYFPKLTMVRSLLCALVAAATVRMMDPYRTGRVVLYEVRYNPDETWQWFEIFFFPIVGLIGGFAGGLLDMLNVRMVRFRKSSNLKLYPIVEVFVLAMLAGLINYPIMFTRIPMGELIRICFNECSEDYEDTTGICDAANRWTVVWQLFVMAFIVRIFLTIITFGCKVPAGIFVPSIALGAAYGRAFGLVLEYLISASPNFFLWATCPTDMPCIISSIYGVVGAAAMLTGVTRSTIAVVVIMFELTGALQYVLPMCIAVIVAKLTAERITKHGIYNLYTSLNGYPFLDIHQNYPGSANTASIMTPASQVVFVRTTGNTLGSLKTFVESVGHRFNIFPLVDNDNKPSGYIHRVDLLGALNDAYTQHWPDDTVVNMVNTFCPQGVYDMRPHLEEVPIVVNTSQTVFNVYNMFRHLGLRYVLVADENYNFAGVVSKKDILRHLHVISNVKDPLKY